MEEFGLMRKTQPEVETENETAETENRSESAGEFTVPVKFNKEVINLKPEEAAVLAQKGMKFDAISGEYEKLKALAANEKKSVPEFLEILSRQKADCRKQELTEQCGGNEKMAEYVFGLEHPESEELGFEELQKEFPDFRSVSDIPNEVVENARLKGRLLLDEYLRFRHENQKTARQAAKAQDRAEASSIGSLKTRTGGIDPEAEQFLKGILK